MTKLWAKCQRDLGRGRNRVTCRLHSVSCELVPSRVPDEIYASKPASLLAKVTPENVVITARLESVWNC